MADEADAAQVEGSEGKGSKSGSKIGMILVVIVAFVTMTLTPLICYLIVKSMAPPTIEENETVVDGKEIVYKVAAVNVNIAETKGTRLIRIEAHLKLSETKLAEELKDSEAMLKDRIMLAASRRTVDQLEGAKGREALKKDIMNEINSIIKGRMTGAVIDVYFSEYLIQ